MSANFLNYYVALLYACSHMVHVAAYIRVVMKYFYILVFILPMLRLLVLDYCAGPSSTGVPFSCILPFLLNHYVELLANVVACKCFG